MWTLSNGLWCIFAPKVEKLRCFLNLLFHVRQKRFTLSQKWNSQLRYICGAPLLMHETEPSLSYTRNAVYPVLFQILKDSFRCVPYMSFLNWNKWICTTHFLDIPAWFHSSTPNETIFLFQSFFVLTKMGAERDREIVEGRVGMCDMKTWTTVVNLWLRCNL